mmetsp:Transcript_34963/g.68033  ORF Transcript_34963/g.68033 Transcript_34963/m.68033 type:complete len:215 (+) Transcript_34963:271-915(+)
MRNSYSRDCLFFFFFFFFFSETSRRVANFFIAFIFLLCHLEPVSCFVWLASLNDVRAFVSFFVTSFITSGVSFSFFASGIGFGVALAFVTLLLFSASSASTLAIGSFFSRSFSFFRSASGSLLYIPFDKTFNCRTENVFLWAGLSGTVRPCVGFSFTLSSFPLSSFPRFVIYNHCILPSFCILTPAETQARKTSFVNFSSAFSSIKKCSVFSGS